MTENQLTAFLNKTLHFFVQFLAIILMYMIVMELTVFYTMSSNIVFYWSSIGVFGIAMVITFQMITEFEHFQTMYEQNVSNSKTELNKPLNVEVEDLPLKACLLYRNGKSFESISEELGLVHVEQARREVKKGLDILLREHKAKEVKTK